MSKLSVVNFDPAAKSKADVVSLAHKVLAMAEAGELVDLTVMGSKPDGSVMTMFTPTDDQYRRLAASSRLLYRLNVAADEAAEDHS